MDDARTSLRLLDLDDAPLLAELRARNADHLRPWEPTRPARFVTRQGQTEYVEQLLRAYENGDGVPFAITTQGRVIGQVTLAGIVRGALQSCSLGYWVGAADTGVGHATRAATLAIGFAFSQLGLHRVQAETLPENAPSRAVLRRNAFVQYGLAPQYLSIDGQWRDHLMFQRLAPAR